MAPIDYGPLPGDIAHNELLELQKALLHIDLFGVMDPFELRRLILALQRHHASGNISSDEVRRVRMALGHLGQTIGEPAVDDDAYRSPGTGDNRTVSD
ncbi:hypothetical protein MTO96_012729 [Rhipicephalus appendiculatus]